MGQCQSCGESAGLFRSECHTCKQQRIDTERQAQQQLLLLEHKQAALPGQVCELFTSYLTSNYNGQQPRQLVTAVKNLTPEDYGNDETRDLVIQGVADALQAALGQELLTENMETRLSRLLTAFKLDPDDLESHDSYETLCKARTLRDLSAGTIQSHFPIRDRLPIKLKRDEIMLWAFEDVTFYKYRTKTVYQNSRQGMSFRVMKGVHYRVGASRGEAVQTDFLDQQGNGVLAITDLAVYFSSSTKSIRLPHEKIISIDPSEEGLALTEDRVNVRPYFFDVSDGQFAATVLHALSQA